MEYGRIEREIHIDAAPEVVYEVISSPGHIREWWGAETQLTPVPGASGELVWGDRTSPESNVVPITVVEAEPPHLFSFRWASADGRQATAANALLVTFELVPTATGTSVRLTETGFRELGWEVAVLEAQYQEHSQGWDHFVPRLGEYVAGLVSSR